MAIKKNDAPEIKVAHISGRYKIIATLLAGLLAVLGLYINKRLHDPPPKDSPARQPAEAESAEGDTGSSGPEKDGSGENEDSRFSQELDNIRKEVEAKHSLRWLYRHPKESMPGNYDAALKTIWAWDLDISWQRKIWGHLYAERNEARYVNWRAIVDGYRAAAFLSDGRSDVEKVEGENFLKNAKGVLQDFISDISKETLRKSYYFDELGIDKNSWHVVGFRVRLGELVFRHPGSDFSYPQAGKYAEIFPPEVRTPDLLDNAWQIARPIAFSIVSRSEFKERHYDKILRGLLDAYNHIETKDYEPVFREMMIEDAKGKGSTRRIGNLRNESLDHLVRGAWSEHFTSWFYSFWYRRYLEGCMEKTVEILQEIDNHYN